MANIGVVQITEAHREASAASVDVVAEAVAETVVCKLRMLDEDVACGIGVAEYAVFVMVKIAVAQRKSRAFEADARAVAVSYCGAGKLQPFYCRIAALEYPDRLALGAGAARAQVRAAARAANRQIVLPPDCNVAVVDARVNFDDIAIAGNSRSIAGSRELPRGADAQQRRLR